MLLSTYYGSIEDLVFCYIGGPNSLSQDVVFGKKYSASWTVHQEFECESGIVESVSYA